MKYLAPLLFILLCQNVNARTEYGLEKINFYPDVDSYLQADYINQNLVISTPKSSINEKSVRNYKNIFNLIYAYKLKWFFFGTMVSYEIASESAANYGVPSDERFSAHDFKDPLFFILARLREQAGSTGNIDLFTSFSDSLGSREVGSSSSNRLNGENTFKLGLSHGLHEEEWEFQNLFQYTFFDEGEEINKFLDKHYLLSSYNVFNYTFRGQYEVNPWFYVNASAGFEYRTIQKIHDRQNEKREIQAGTGSIFRLGVKKPLSPWSIVELSAELKRNNYFVKGDSNFDGDATQTTYMLSFIQGF